MVVLTVPIHMPHDVIFPLTHAFHHSTPLYILIIFAAGLPFLAVLVVLVADFPKDPLEKIFLFICAIGGRETAFPVELTDVWS